MSPVPDADESQLPSSQAAKLPDEQPPFKDFQAVLAFLSSIGLATAASGAFGLVGATSQFGDTSDHALSALKDGATMLSWASACFIIALALIVAAQLLYTEIVIVKIITDKSMTGWQQSVVRVAVGVFAWASLGFQTTAMLLLSQSLELFAPGPARMARYGICGGMILVASVTVIGITSTHEGKQKLAKLMPW